MSPDLATTPRWTMTCPPGRFGPSAGRQDQPEAGAMRVRWLVREAAAVSARIGSRDREPQAGSFTVVRRKPREAIEEPVCEVRRNAGAAVLHHHVEVAAFAVRGHDDRWAAVAARVDEDVRHHAVEGLRIDCRAQAIGNVDRHVGAALEDGARQLYEPGTNVNRGRRHPDRVGLQPGKVEQAVDQVDESRRLLCEHATQLAALLIRKLVLALVQRPHRPVDRASRRTQLVGGERDELALQFVEATQLAVLDRLLEETGDESPERGQQVDLGLVENKTLSALVAGHEAEAAAVRGERHDHEGAQPEVPCDPLWHRRLGARILDVHGAPRGERPRERAEMPNWKRRRQRSDLLHRQAVACEGHEGRRFGQKADDADALKAEAAGNCSTRALKHGTRTELSARKSAGEAM